MTKKHSEALLETKFNSEDLLGIRIIKPLTPPIPRCPECDAQRLCDKVIQEESTVITPDSPTCRIISKDTGPKFN